VPVLLDLADKSKVEAVRQASLAALQPSEDPKIAKQ